ncbi:MAG: hypothetical protein JEZ00_20345 [Anaerolineaceae bacterium]|nr:hypothetical protein [Anaerolineaceae bacterium]
MKLNINKFISKRVLLLVSSSLLIVLLSAFQFLKSPSPQTPVNINPPDNTVKLIFIHHSCGENLLDDNGGALGQRLAENNYFVSDTNYGWGPDNIGDRTDILDWPEWFLGSDSNRYMDTVFNESGQNSSYSRLSADPGGENQIIMFKSCFPNSDMGGSAHDAPRNDGSLTVASAKQIYIDLLSSFAQHPDKLFVVLTAPPMREISQPQNARAFNTWLVEDWLDEAQYAYENVAVWDFYNVLSAKNNHHRILNGEIQYITDQGGDTLYYPDGDDDHPSRAGNMKAAEEFVPMLNSFYHLWQNNAPANGQAPVVSEEDEGAVPSSGESNPDTERVINLSGVFDNFDESGIVWECFADEGANTQISCNQQARADDASNQAFHMEFSVAPQSWATTVTFFPEQLSIAETAGLSMEFANPGNNPINLVVYRGNDENQETYLYSLPLEGHTDWRHLSVAWDDFKRAEWESGNQESLIADQISGFGFGFDGLDSEQNSGEAWVDNITWLSADAAQQPDVDQVESPADQDESTNMETEEDDDSEGGLPFCPGSGAFLFVVLGIGLVLQKGRLFP